MDILLVAIIIFVALFALGYPLINPRRYHYANAVRGNAQLETLENARRQVMDALRDLQFDHATDKLSDADYGALRSQYELKAARILQQLDVLKGQPHAKISKANCPRCHQPIETTDKFCAKCGARL